MLKNIWSIRSVLVLLMIVATAAVVLGAGKAASSDDARVIYTPGVGERIVSRVQIIQFDDTIARFDSSTGAIHKYNGDPSKPNVRGQWIRHVRGVDDRTSGILEIQKPRGVHADKTTFLVDVVKGDTWILRRRGGDASWEAVHVLR